MIKNKKRTFTHFTFSEAFPLLISLVATFATLVIYSLTSDEHDILLYLRVSLSAFAPVILPIIERLLNRDFPRYVNYLITVHIILASDLGIALGFYDRFANYDLVMHGFFGLLAAVVAALFIKIWCGDEIDRIGLCVLVLLSVLGAAAAWEIIEFCGDTFFGMDSQCVKAAIAAGTNPIEDTMTDIIIAIPGALLWCVAHLVRSGKNKH